MWLRGKGTPFPSPNKHHLGAAKQALPVPVVAIGGINCENGADLVRAGADLLAVISALFGDADIEAAARGLAGLYRP